MTSAFDLDAWLTAPGQPAIVQAGAPVLRRRAAQVPNAMLGTAPLLRLVERMVDAMRAAPGVGLAAPQVGVPLRIFVAEDSEDRLAHLSPEWLAARGRAALPLVVIVNPTLTKLTTAATASGEASELPTFFEGCLSVRGYGALVPRAAAVHVTGVDPEGRPVALDLRGWPARIMQHEMDHLDGILYVDRMIARSFAADAELARWGGVPVNEVMKVLVDAADVPIDP